MSHLSPSCTTTPARARLPRVPGLVGLLQAPSAALHPRRLGDLKRASAQAPPAPNHPRLRRQPGGRLLAPMVRRRRRGSRCGVLALLLQGAGAFTAGRWRSGRGVRSCGAGPALLSCCQSGTPSERPLSRSSRRGCPRAARGRLSTLGRCRQSAGTSGSRSL